MGSIAMDRAGDIALGYSLTSANRHPRSRYTARRGGDPLGQMTLGEGLLSRALGSQTATRSRWGDYSSMSVDPNGCTFWFTPSTTSARTASTGARASARSRFRCAAIRSSA